MAVLQKEGWAMFQGNDDVWDKPYRSIGNQTAAAYLHVWNDLHAFTVKFDFYSEGRNVCEADSALIYPEDSAEKATAAIEQALKNVERSIRESYACRFADYA